MSEYIFLAFTNPLKGREDEYNDWYDNIAVPAYKTIPGFKHHGRYTLVDAPKMFEFAMDSDWQYLSIYTFETDDLNDFLARGAEALALIKGYSLSEAIDKSCFFEPMYVKR